MKPFFPTSLPSRGFSIDQVDLPYLEPSHATGLLPLVTNAVEWFFHAWRSRLQTEWRPGEESEDTVSVYARVLDCDFRMDWFMLDADYPQLVAIPILVVVYESLHKPLYKKRERKSPPRISP